MPFILKKAKGVYLYDTKANKYRDFSLQQGEVWLGHAHPSLTKYAKNALSSGMSHAGFEVRFTEKATRLWQKKYSLPVSCHNTLLEALCAFIKHHKITALGFTNEYLRGLLQPLDGIIRIQEQADWMLYEPALGSAPSPTSLAVHSRFHYREPATFGTHNLLHASPFGGKPCSLLIGQDVPPSSLLGFEEALIMSEGAKFSALDFPAFSHPLLEMHVGWARIKKPLDAEQLRQQGVYISNEYIFFSPSHSENDLKHLRKALDLFL
ncbi:MAG: aminotransferase class III-fold pyridoxal phosphate-dependent enzyme [Brevinema sp.]